MYSFQKCKRFFFFFCPSWSAVGWSLPSECSSISPQQLVQYTRPRTSPPSIGQLKKVKVSCARIQCVTTLKKCRLNVTFRALEHERDGSQISFYSISWLKCQVLLFQTIQCVCDLGYACSNSVDIAFRQGLERLAFHRNRSLAELTGCEDFASLCLVEGATNCKCRSSLTRAI